MSWVVDIVLDGTGSVALLGPFRSEERAEGLRDQIEKACKANQIAGYFPTLSEVYPPSDWRQHVDLSP